MDRITLPYDRCLVGTNALVVGGNKTVCAVRNQFKCEIYRVHISCLVKQRNRFWEFFHEILPDYMIEKQNSLDEGVSVCYNTISRIMEKQFRLAEAVKKEFYGYTKTLWVVLSSLSVAESAAVWIFIDKWRLSVFEKDGLTVRKEFPEISISIYELELLLKYENGCYQDGIAKDQVFCLEVHTKKNWQMGDWIVRNGQAYPVFDRRIVWEHGELVCIYRLGRKGMFYQKKLYPVHLAGARIEGVIQKCREETVYLQLDIDSEERADYPWCWTPETSNLCYCMPEVGTKAVLYLPTKEEKDGQVILAAVSSQGKQGRNVEQREFQTKDQKKIGLYPDRLFLEGTEKKELLSLEDAAGIRLFSEKSISFQAAETIKISGRVITGVAPFEVLCRTKSANIAICRDLNFYAPAGVKTIGNGERSDKGRMTEQKEREEKEKPEYWMLAYAALGAIPAMYLPDITGTKDLAALFALGSIPIVGRGDVIVSLAEVMEGKREKETTFPDAFHSMENYVVKGGYELPGVVAAEERKFR